MFGKNKTVCSFLKHKITADKSSQHWKLNHTHTASVNRAYYSHCCRSESFFHRACYPFEKILAHVLKLCSRHFGSKVLFFKCPFNLQQETQEGVCWYSKVECIVDTCFFSGGRGMFLCFISKHRVSSLS